jgi:enoyl-CoA hydratase/carnithine racemase
MFVIVLRYHLCFHRGITCFQGSGRAFCAGGDVVAGVQSINNGTHPASKKNAILVFGQFKLFHFDHVYMKNINIYVAS